jgi:hypothetical protein
MSGSSRGSSWPRPWTSVTLGAEEREHRGELAADVPAAQNRQARREPVELQDRLRGPYVRFTDAGQVGNRGSGPSVDHDVAAADPSGVPVPSPDLDGARGDEVRIAQDEVHPRLVEHLLVGRLVTSRPTPATRRTPSEAERAKAVVGIAEKVEEVGPRRPRL